MLAIDIGNTEIALGYYKGNELTRHWRIQTRPGITADELHATLLPLLQTANIRWDELNNIFIASVVPAMNQSFTQVFRQQKIKFVDHTCNFSFKINLPNPAQIGADRLVNAEAVFQLYGKPAIIVDAGTATTFCALDQTGNYLGGAIAPGMSVSALALIHKAARLSHVDLVAAERTIGNSTEEAMKSGIVNGHAAMIDGMILRLKKEINHQDPVTVATGGFIQTLRPLLTQVKHTDPLLTLKGLMLLAQRS